MRPTPTGVERTFSRDDIIVSKTDMTGKITYSNDVFLRVSGYDIDEVIGAPHSFIRHPDMPRAVFAVLWETVQQGREVFAYVNNLVKSGDHYWVLAHVTPSFDGRGRVVGYHSNRRSPDRGAVRAASALYATLLQAERTADRAAGLRASRALLQEAAAPTGGYAPFVFSLTPAEAA